VKNRESTSLSPPVPPVPPAPVLPVSAAAAGAEVERLVLGDLLLLALALANGLEEAGSNLDGVLLGAERIEANTSLGANTFGVGGAGGSTRGALTPVVIEAFEGGGALGPEVAITGARQLGTAELAGDLGAAVGEAAFVEGGIAVAAGCDHSLRAGGKGG